MYVKLVRNGEMGSRYAGAGQAGRQNPHKNKQQLQKLHIMYLMHLCDWEAAVRRGDTLAYAVD